MAMLIAALFGVIRIPFQPSPNPPVLQYSSTELLFLMFDVAAGLFFTVAAVLWVQATLRNQEQLQVPLPLGTVWIRLFFGSVIPVIGALLLFQFAHNLLRASSEAAGQTFQRPNWFLPWLVSYLLGTGLGYSYVFSDLRWLLFLQLVAMVVAFLGFYRFLDTVEQNQVQSAKLSLAQNRPPSDSQATPIPSD